MYKRYHSVGITRYGWRQLANRRMLVSLILAFAIVSTLVVPLSTVEANVSRGVEDLYWSLAVSGNVGTSDAPETAVQYQRELPVTATVGEEFAVTVTFVAPVDGFHAIGLTDLVPAGWTVSVDLAWTEPQAILAHTPEPEEAVYIWMGPFAAGVEFTAVYKVTVPVGVRPGTYLFGGSLEYYIEPFPAPSYWTRPAGGLQVQVVDAPVAPTARITGVIKEVSGGILAGTSVVLYRDGQAVASDVSDQNGTYSLAVPELGDYALIASKPGFRDEAQAISVTEPTTRLLDFAGDCGLIPRAPARTYVLACVDLWQRGDASSQLSTSRLLDVISASKYPSR
jgi:hypothetical protein